MAAGVTTLGAWAARATGVAVSGPTLAVLLCGTLVIYNLDHLRDDRRRARSQEGARPRLGHGLRWTVLVLATVGLTVGFVLGGRPLLLAALPAGVVGLLYGAPLGPLRLKDLPGAKAWLVATAVTHACVLMPALAAGEPVAGSASVAAFVLALTALDAHCFDVRDVDVDRAAGSETWATRLGEAAAHRRLVGLAGLAAIVFAALTLGGRLTWVAPATLALAAATLPLVGPGARRARFGVVVDGWLFLPWLLSLVAG